MTTLQESFVAHLKANNSLVALIGVRIHPNVIPQDWPLPALAYQRVGSDEDLPHNAARTWGQTRVQFTAQGESYADATNVVNAVKEALRGFRGQMGGGVQVHGVFIENDLDGFGDELDRATARVDALFIHREG